MTTRTAQIVPDANTNYEECLVNERASSPPADEKQIHQLGADVVSICKQTEFLAVAQDAVAILNSSFQITEALIEASTLRKDRKSRGTSSPGVWP
jgi:hypothetical protein